MHSSQAGNVGHFLIAVVLQLILSPLLGADTPGRPNVVVILADDQGWGDLSLHGNPNLSTPNIDALARSGAVIEHFYVCAVCSPTRAEFLTGRYHTRMGVRGTSVGRERFAAGERTIAQYFRDAGYATAAYGKWHSGMQFPYHPNARGFDDYYGFCSGHWDNYFSPMLERNGQIVRGSGYLTDDLTNHAIEFIDGHRDKPFFLYLPLNVPHSPMQVPDEFWDRFKDKTLVPDPAEENATKQNLVHTRAALAMCESIDANVGRLLAHLDATGLAENTIVVYFSDNGPNGHRFNGGMRGTKGTTFEGGLRSPCLIRYPNRIVPGTRVRQIAGAIDLLPTLADLAGTTVNSPKPLDGVSIAALLDGSENALPPRLLFSSWGRRASVRTARWRMHSSGMLFDIENDPRESTDVSAARPDLAAELLASLSNWLATTRAEGPGENLPFTLGHPDSTYTQLPARDALPHGDVRRNNRHPNCTYITNWTSVDDKITWDVDVLGEGEFEVEMYYACPESSIGSEIELSLGDQRINVPIREANDVHDTGMEHDRFKRREGYVKAWRAMQLGTMQIRPGRGTLTLRATKIVGDQLGDMRLLMFRRVGDR